MNVYKKLPLVDVVNDDKFVELVFLDDVSHEAHSVKWNKQSFNKDKKEWEDNPDKIQQVEEWSNTYFGTDLKDIDKAIGTEHTIYSYPTFDSLWEVASKFDPKLKGQVIQAEIDKVELSPTSINIWYRFKDNLYMSRMRFEKVINGVSYTDATKKNKRYNEFQEKFQTTVDDALSGSLKGKKINVLIKTFSNNVFGEIQSLVLFE